MIIGRQRKKQPSSVRSPVLSDLMRYLSLSISSQPVDDKEILSALIALPLGKAPGIDGFGASFYHSYWSIIKGRVTSAIKRFFITGHMPPVGRGHLSLSFLRTNDELEKVTTD